MANACRDFWPKSSIINIRKAHNSRTCQYLFAKLSPLLPQPKLLNEPHSRALHKCPDTRRLIPTTALASVLPVKFFMSLPYHWHLAGFFLSVLRIAVSLKFHRISTQPPLAGCVCLCTLRNDKCFSTTDHGKTSLLSWQRPHDGAHGENAYPEEI